MQVDRGITVTEAVLAWREGGYHIQYRPYSILDVEIIEVIADGEIGLAGGRTIMVRQSGQEVSKMVNARIEERRRAEDPLSWHGST